MKNKSIPIFLVVCMLIIAVSAQAKTPALTTKQLPTVTKEKNSIHVSVTPNTELLSIVQYLATQQDGNMTNYTFEYKKSIDKYFNKFKDHETVKFVNKLAQDGFSYDAPPTAVLYLDNEFNLKQDMQYTPYLISRANGQENLNTLSQLLKKFYVDTNFEQFYTSNLKYYDQIVNTTLEAMETKNYVKELEDYYGLKQKSYNLILVSLYHHGGYGPRVESKKNQYDIYSIIGPSGTKDNHPIFGDKEYFKYLQRHEFSHSFVNPLGEVNQEHLNKYSRLYDPIQEVMSAQAYSEWSIAVNEHIVRAVTTRMAYKDSKQEGDYWLQYEKDNCFIYIDELLKKLEIYENNRDKYPTFETFYPELIKAFEYYLSPERLSQIQNLRSINSVLMQPKQRIIVIPSTYKAHYSNNKKYIEDVWNQIGNAKIITDKDALNMDISNLDLIIYGTFKENLLLQKYKDKFNFTIENNVITLQNNTFKGDKIQLMTAVTHPDNPAKSFIIYTANNEENIYGIQDHFHGPKAYHVYMGEEQVLSGFYTEITVHSK